ncbi:23066_t:CDS:1, partial [Racocetra persica]
ICNEQDMVEGEDASAEILYYLEIISLSDSSELESLFSVILLYDKKLSREIYLFNNH